MIVTRLCGYYFYKTTDMKYRSVRQTWYISPMKPVVHLNGETMCVTLRFELEYEESHTFYSANVFTAWVMYQNCL